MPLPSSGGTLLAQMLKMSSLENLEKFEQNSPETAVSYTHLDVYKRQIKKIRLQ